jgi:hypothetical protein
VEVSRQPAAIFWSKGKDAIFDVINFSVEMFQSKTTSAGLDFVERLLKFKRVHATDQYR